MLFRSNRVADAPVRFGGETISECEMVEESESVDESLGDCHSWCDCESSAHNVHTSTD